MADAKYSSLSSQRYTSFITEVYPPCGLRHDNSPLLSCFLSPIDAKVRDLSAPSRYIVLAEQFPPRRVLINKTVHLRRPRPVSSRRVEWFAARTIRTRSMRVRRCLRRVLALYQPFSHVVNARLTLFSLRYRHVALLARCLRAFFPFDRSESRSSSEPTSEFYRKTRGAA